MVVIPSTDEFVIAWRAWYDNDTATPVEYNSIDHTLEDLPDDGFQAMRLWYSEITGRVLSGNSYYFFAQHIAGTIFGATENFSDIERYFNPIVKRGKHVPDGMMHQINDLMMNSVMPKP